jgi:glutamyl-Q tRNA(Asp) synthetase
MMPEFTPPVLRFAPSPNGLLHLGHAYSALLNFALARARGGRLLLRIEDIDPVRCKPEFATAIEQDLAWIGFTWERPVRRQSEHFETYAAALDELVRRGLAYPCFCTRGDRLRAIAGRSDWPRDPDGTPLYPGTCKDLSSAVRAARLANGETAVLRLDCGAALAACGCELSWREEDEGGALRMIAARPALWGDTVIRRRDVPTSYHLAVVVDDATQGVTNIVHGRDLYEATSLHRLLQALLGLPAPIYRHHPLVLDETGHKLSKSTHATSLRALREAGVPAAAVRQQLGFA